MKRSYLKAAAALSMTAVSIASSTAFAHAALQSSSPKSGDILTVAPTAVVLRFNETLEASFNRITLVRLSNGVVTTTKATVDAAHPDTLRLPLSRLGSGSYQVQWSTLTKDGHRTKGQYGFQVK